MSDIDFDELDRAVNGALGGNPINPRPLPVENGVGAGAVESPAVEPVVETPAIAEAATDTSEAITVTVMSNPVAPAVRRTSGRFMDMVHTSSDMRPQASRSEASPTPVAVPSTPQVSEEEAPTLETPAWDEPLESPFLTDAKVEKRPLGGATPMSGSLFADTLDFQDFLNDEPKDELLDAPEEQELLEATTMPDPIDFAAANATTQELELQAVEAEGPTVFEEVSAAEGLVELADVPEHSHASFESPLIDEPVGPASITPQYKEQPSSIQESGAIYDTESYHQPVAQPVKKKSGWLVVMWIVLLVIFGAAAGWAVFTYVLPML